tara:strand:+ start:1893 stop:2462 length:570 start_codon:yes stop_codon:yes gene_type:complete
MRILNYIPKSALILVTGLFVISFLNSCGFYKPVDSRIVSPNSKERVKKNLEEGRGISFGKMMDGGARGTSYQFASSNPMWRATLEILDFLPLANVDYSGGIITTDWYNEGTSIDESIKITVRFLTNEIRSDGLRIIVHKKRCNVEQSCKISKISSTLEQELQVAILKKAMIFEKEYNKNKKKYKRSEVN